MATIGKRVLALGAAALLGLAVLAPAGESAAAPVPPGTQGRPPVAEGNQWRVDPVAEGLRVTLRLATPVPLRGALPLLAVDGRPVGVARQSADRRTLTVVSKDPRVAAAKDVKLVWSTDPATKTGRTRATAAATDAYWLNPLRGPAIPVDPGAAGKYGVDTTEYDLGDEAVHLPGLGRRAEVRGRVWSPRGARGPRPLVVFLHGRHQFCYGEEPGTEPAKPWPCPPGMKALPSYRGYDAPARALASHGYQVVSISANAINAYDDGAIDAGALARGQLVLHHLDLWKRWSTIGGGPYGRRFVGKVDLRAVGLMGHSRGGEGVARAAVLNSQRGGRYGIRAVLPLAPTNFARLTVPGVAMSVLLPYCDGDVFDLQGQKFYDDTRYALDGDRAPRSTVLMLGANHNYFNTEWTPGQSVAPSDDDWGGEERGSPCGLKAAARLSAKEQQAAGRAYIAGFFRLHLGSEKAILPLFDGSDSRAASAGRAVVRVVSQAPAHRRRDIARFDRALPPGAVSGAVGAQVCADAENPAPTAAAGRALPPCVKSVPEWQLPHWGDAYFARAAPTAAVTKLNWTAKSGVVRVNLAPTQRDVRRYQALTFRAAPDPTGAARTDLTVRVVDGSGRSVAVPVSTVSDALVQLPGSKADSLPRTLLRTVRIPLRSLRTLDLRDLRAVELRTDRVRSGSVFVSDLAFAQPEVGRSAPLRLPSLSASNVRLAEGDAGTRAADFWVTMSRPSLVPVTVYAETSTAEGENGVVPSLSRRLVFPPGRTRLKMTVPVQGNTRDGYDVSFALVLSLPRHAIVGNSFGAGLVLDDDPAPKLSVGDAVAVEGSKVLRFPVRLSAPSDKWPSVTGELRSGTARLGPDFRSAADDGEGPPESAAATYLDRGETTGWVSVVLVDDKVKEPAERFTFRVGEVDEAEPTGPATVTATIRDDD